MITKSLSQKGFALIEVITVVAIIGILATIAIPQFTAYRERAFNTAAKADLRNAATAQEAYYVRHSTYAQDIANLMGASYGLYISAGVNIVIAADAYGYTINSSHTSGDVTYAITGPGGLIAY